ncbi:MAG: hypothetical protein JOY93_05590, partial [Acidobacteriales bacterium]|nr:hypothetical protein [Terriglobales bacterium]
MPDTTKRVDRAEIIRRMDRAEKLLQKGKTADALDSYLEILVDDPSNDTARQMAADLCLSLQRVPEAVTLLGELFQRQIQAADPNRASLTYKKLARFVAPTWEQKVSFGQLMESSNSKIAMETYEEAITGLIQEGRKAEALGVLQRVVNR